MKTFLTTYWKHLLAMTGIFVAGAVVGGVLTTAVIVNRVKANINPEKWNGLAMERLDDRLHFTAEQRTKVEPIVNSTVDDLRVILHQALVDWGEEMAQGRQRLEPLLSETQRAELDQMAEQRRARMGEILKRLVP